MSGITVMQENTQSIRINRGTGAGGANTNHNGKKFEKKTDYQKRLLEMGYTQNSFEKKPKLACHYHLSKIFEDKTIYFVSQKGLRKFMEHKYNIVDVFRNPDEAYIIEYNSGRKVVKILEKKKQKGSGSVETKIMAGPSFIREYQLVLGADFEVEYGFCLNSYFKDKFVSSRKQYIILNAILNEHNIAVLFGDDDNYRETVDTWINSSA